MNTFTRWRTTVAACRKYNQYRRTGDRRMLCEAERLAHKVGEMDADGICPAMFHGKPILEREWASGRGPEFLYNWLVRQGRFEAGA